MMCPEVFALMEGRIALMMLTGPKKFVSNWLRVNVLVIGDTASSSTDPRIAANSNQLRVVCALFLEKESTFTRAAE